MTGCCPPALTEGITQVLISFVTLLNLVRKLLSGSLAMTAMTHVLFPKTRWQIIKMYIDSNCLSHSCHEYTQAIIRKTVTKFFFTIKIISIFAWNNHLSCKLWIYFCLQSLTMKRKTTVKAVLNRLCKFRLKSKILQVPYPTRMSLAVSVLHS